MPDLASLVETRMKRPEAIAEAAAARERPAPPERLMVIAADHTARGILEAGGPRWPIAATCSTGSCSRSRAQA